MSAMQALETLTRILDEQIAKIDLCNVRDSGKRTKLADVVNAIDEANFNAKAALEAQADQPGAVVVKPLEWQKSALGNTLERANTILGSYRVWTYAGANGVWCWSLQSTRDGTADTLEGAKAAAQADYERRIRSALKPRAVALPSACSGRSALQGNVEAERRCCCGCCHGPARSRRRDRGTAGRDRRPTSATSIVGRNSPRRRQSS